MNSGVQGRGTICCFPQGAPPEYDHTLGIPLRKETPKVGIELNTLLVALMFVTILCMGIGNILVSLADILNRASISQRSRAHVSWMVLLLLLHFILFWHTKEILNVENWRFSGFLLTILGPVLMFFATSILLTNPSEEDEEDLPAFFQRLGRPFFWMFALIQGWNLGAGYTLSGGWMPEDALNLAFVVLALALVFTTSPRLQRMGAVAAWLIMVGLLSVRWLIGPAS